MKRFFTLLLACVCLLAGCKQEEHEKETVQWDAKPSIVVDGDLYGATGRSGVYETTEIPENGGQVDGEITSSVESYEYPTEDDRSNFGIGYPYRYGEASTIEVYFSSSKKWIIYEAYQEE